jgi:hypothetical protein
LRISNELACAVLAVTQVKAACAKGIVHSLGSYHFSPLTNPVFD